MNKLYEFKFTELNLFRVLKTAKIIKKSFGASIFSFLFICWSYLSKQKAWIYSSCNANLSSDFLFLNNVFFFDFQHTNIQLKKRKYNIFRKRSASSSDRVMFESSFKKNLLLNRKDKDLDLFCPLPPSTTTNSLVSGFILPAPPAHLLFFNIVTCYMRQHNL